jgi:hypothetical protein
VSTTSANVLNVQTTVGHHLDTEECLLVRLLYTNRPNTGCSVPNNQCRNLRTDEGGTPPPCFASFKSFYELVNERMPRVASVVLLKLGAASYSGCSARAGDNPGAALFAPGAVVSHKEPRV